MPRRVYLLAPDFSGMGGFQIQLSLLAEGLARRGVRVRVYVRAPVARQHPYWQSMMQAGVAVYGPPKRLASFLSPPTGFRRALYGAANAVLAALLLPLIFVDALVRRRPLARSWQGALGMIGGKLAWMVDFDALTWWMERRLDWDAAFYPPDLIDVQHSMLPSGIRYGKARALPVVYTEYGAPSADLESVWAGLRPVINQADFIIGRAAASITGLRELCRADRPSTIIPNAVASAPVGVTVPQMQDEIAVAMIGRLSPEKGPDYLLEAFQILARRRPNVRLIFAGEGPMRPSLQARAEASDLRNRVTFTGEFGDLDSVLRQAHIIAHPTLNDGRSVAVLEAMAWGRPVVATCVGGLPELITDGVNGYLVPPRDPQSMAAALEKLVVEPQLIAKFGAAGRDRFLRGQFTIEAMVDATLRVYDTVVKSGHNRR